MFYAAYRANISQPGPVQWNKYCRKWYKNGVWSLMVVVNSWTDRNTSTFEGYSIQRLPEGIIAGYSSLEEGIGTSRAIVYELHIQYSSQTACWDYLKQYISAKIRNHMPKF